VPDRDEAEPVGSLVAIGDSIVNGFTTPVAGVPALGCGQWLAIGLDHSYTRYAQGGWTSSQIAENLLPRVRSHYDIAVLSVGTNDAVKRIPLDQFEINATRIVSKAVEHANAVAVLSIPLSETYSACLAAVVERLGAVTIEARLAGARFVSADLVHPTALGTQVLADRIAVALDLDVEPSRIIRPGRIPVGYYTTYGAATVKPALKRLARKALDTMSSRRSRN
jgi:lysophospholipase L1-like esterase